MGKRVFRGICLATILCVLPEARVEAQLEPVPTPEPPAVLPSLPPQVVPPISLLSLPGQGGGSGRVGKLDFTLSTALEQITEPGINRLELLRRLNLDVNERLAVLVDVEVAGNLTQVRERIEGLNGLLINSRFRGGDLRARLLLAQLPVLAEERAVVAIRAVLKAVDASAPAFDIGGALPAAPEFGGGVPRELPSRALDAIRSAIQEKRGRTAAQKKLESALLLAAKRSRNAPVANGALDRVAPTLTRDPGNRILVEIRLSEADGSLLNQIRLLGGQVTGQVDRFLWLQAFVPVNRLEALAALRSVRSVRRAILPDTRIHNRSEGDIRHRVDLIRGQFGFDGTGVKIGVVSDGIDTLDARQQANDLPGNIVVLPGQHGSGDEGTAILEVVNDLAPGAELFFATGFPSEAQMAQNILELATAGCNVIVDDVGHLLAPVFQDGLAAQAVETVFQQGVTYVSAAGNSGNFDAGTSGVWEGDFLAAELTIEGQTYEVHDFGGGVLFNELRTDPRSLLVLQWSDPIGAAANDYDLLLLNEHGDEIVAISNNVQDGFGDPIEFIDSRLEDHIWYRAVIVRSAGEDRFLRLDSFGAELETVTAGQVFGHPAAENAIAVGAVYQANGQFGPGYFDGDEPVEPFSSDGPRRIFFGLDGNPITPGDFGASGGVLREKPDFVAADGVATNTPFYEQFFGTSAAAPHVGAIAALLVQRGVESPVHIRQLLRASALDIEVPGFDRKSGHGIVDAFRAMTTPLAVDDSLTVIQQPASILSESTLLDNDQPGVGGGELSLSSVGPDTLQGGAVTIENGLIVYRPPVGFVGVDEFTYSVAGVSGPGVSARVTIEVQPPPPADLSLAIGSVAAASVTLTLSGNPGQTVVVEQTSTLILGVTWTQVASVTLDGEGRASVGVPFSGNVGFLRLREP